VATDVGGVRELLLADPARPAGVVVPRRDPTALADAIFSLLGDADEARRLGANGRAIAAERFSLDAAVAAHLAVYRALAGPGAVG